MLENAGRMYRKLSGSRRDFDFMTRYSLFDLETRNEEARILYQPAGL